MYSATVYKFVIVWLDKEFDFFYSLMVKLEQLPFVA